MPVSGTWIFFVRRSKIRCLFFFWRLIEKQLQFLCTMSSTDTNRPEEKQEKQSKAPRKEALFASPAFRTSGC